MKIKKAPSKAETFEGAVIFRGIYQFIRFLKTQKCHSKVLNSDLLYVCLLDFVREPGRAICRFVNH